MATSKVLKPRRGSTVEHSTFKGQAFEITFDTDKKTIVAHDGLTMGGFPLAHEEDIVETDTALRALIDQKIAEVGGVSSSELQALDSALRSLINTNNQQQTAKNEDQDNVISALDTALRALIAQEVANAMSAANAAQSSADAANTAAANAQTAAETAQDTADSKVATVNGQAPDGTGNVNISAPVTSVNGLTGAVTVGTVRSVNGAAPNASGNVSITFGTVVQKLNTSVSLGEATKTVSGLKALKPVYIGFVPKSSSYAIQMTVTSGTAVNGSKSSASGSVSAHTAMWLTVIPTGTSIAVYLYNPSDSSSVSGTLVVYQ